MKNIAYAMLLRASSQILKARYGSFLILLLKHKVRSFLNEGLGGSNNGTRLRGLSQLKVLTG